MGLDLELPINKLYIGGKVVYGGSVYLGNTQVKQIYVGTKKIYDRIGATPID